jgi:ATP-dependent DNA ligase
MRDRRRGHRGRRTRPPVFDALRYRLRDHAAVLCAFDLIELDSEDLRGARLENRKRTLAGLLRGTDDGIAFNKHFEGDGAIVFRHACALGCEGIVSKRLGSAYRSGRVNHWLKVKNPVAPIRDRPFFPWSAEASMRVAIYARVSTDDKGRNPEN